MSNALFTTPAYRAWIGLKQRCKNERHPQWPKTGGRGITFDPRWNSYQCFTEDMGPKPKGAALARRDNNGNFTKDNSYWHLPGDDRACYSNNSCGYKYVSFHRPTKKWVSYIRVNGVQKNLGYFVSAEEANAKRQSCLTA